MCPTKGRLARPVSTGMLRGLLGLGGVCGDDVPVEGLADCCPDVFGEEFSDEIDAEGVSTVDGVGTEMYGMPSSAIHWLPLVCYQLNPLAVGSTDVVPER